MVSYLFLFLILAAIVAYYIASRKAVRVTGDDYRGLHSRPIYHGLNALVYTAIPALIFVLLWMLFEGSILDMLVLGAYPGSDAMTGPERDLLISEIRQVCRRQYLQGTDTGGGCRRRTPQVT